MILTPYFQQLREVLRERHWIQGDFDTPWGVCLMGAIHVVGATEEDDGDEFRLCTSLTLVLADQITGGDPMRISRAYASAPEYASESIRQYAVDSITRWNDTNGRTYDEVDQLLAQLAEPAPIAEPQPEDEAVCV